MIDIHNHIIYDVDDGSKSVEQSVKMIKMAQETGYTDICLTPHYMEDGYKSSRGILESKLMVIKEELLKENININLYLGEEIYIFPSLADRLDEVITLNDSKYVLIELPLNEKAEFAESVIFKLQSMGKMVILAHPERYFESKQNYSFISNLAKKGVLMQININSLVGHYGEESQKIATRMLKEHMAIFVATDAHSQAGYATAKDSLQILKKLVSEEYFFDLTEGNPSKVLGNIDIDPWNYRESENAKKISNPFLSFLKSMPFASKL